MWISRIALVFSILMVFSACSPESASAKNKSGKSGPTQSGPPWNWEAYPPMTLMRIATLPCQLQPKSTITVVSPISGLLRLHVTSPEAHLEANRLWAEFEPEIFAQEEIALAESLKKLEDQERVQWEVEYPRKKMQLSQQVEDAELELKKVQLLSKDDELARKMLHVGTNLALLKPETLAKTEANLRLLKQSLSYLESTNFAALGFDLAGLRTEWKRRELDFQRRRQQARFEMPFDGKLTLGIPISDGVTNYPVNVGQELAVARDISSVRVRVVMENVAWTGLQPEKMKAVVRSAGQSFEAKFTYQKIERVQNREESAYYFEFPPEQAKAAARLIGANVAAELWMTLPEPARIVPKLAIILHKPDAFQNHNWPSALASTFPGTRLLVEGQTDLAVVTPKELKLSSAQTSAK